MNELKVKLWTILLYPYLVFNKRYKRIKKQTFVNKLMHDYDEWKFDKHCAIYKDKLVFWIANGRFGFECQNQNIHLSFFEERKLWKWLQMAMKYQATKI